MLYEITELRHWNPFFSFCETLKKFMMYQKVW